MKKLLLLLILSIISNSAFAANSSTIEGVWRGMQACEWDKESWGGGEYEPGNAKFSGAFNFTIIDDSSSADKKKFKAKKLD